MIELASSAVEAALAAGARYADARVMVVRHETIAGRNGVVEDLTQAETAGIGVRALLGSSWGFQATPELTDAAARAAGAGATAVARSRRARVRSGRGACPSAPTSSGTVGSSPGQPGGTRGECGSVPVGVAIRTGSTRTGPHRRDRGR